MSSNEPQINDPIKEMLSDLKGLPERYYRMPKLFRVWIAIILNIFVGYSLIFWIGESLKQSNGIYFLLAIGGGLIVEGMIMPLISAMIIVPLPFKKGLMVALSNSWALVANLIKNRSKERS